MRRAAVILAALAIAGSAQAAEFAVVDGIDGRAAVRVWGDIATNDAPRLGQFLQTHERVYSMIVSGEGGSAYAATKLGTFVHALNMPVAVAAREHCASACALVWAGAIRRVIEPGASVGFHGVFTTVDGQPRPSSDGNAVIGSYLGRLGYSDPAIAYMTAKPPAEMQWLTEADAHRYGLDYAVASPAPLKRPAATIE